MLKLCHMLRSRTDGNVAIEFALIAPILFLLFFGIIEFGLIQFSSTVIESATNMTTRNATIGNAGGAANREQYIRDLIQQRTFGLVNGSELIITTDVAAPGGAYNPERCVNGGLCPCNGPFVDTNGNGICDAPGSAPLEPGGPGALVHYKIVYPWHTLTPLLASFIGGNNGVLYLTSNSYVKNEPF